MSKVGPKGRSYLPITIDDLHRLREIEAADRAAFFTQHPDWHQLYGDRLLCVALCQGAALHYVTGEVGINDFDVYTFFARNSAKAWPARRHTFYDFGEGKFGQSEDKPAYFGRRVDIFGRSIDVLSGDSPVKAVQAYLRSGRTQTARCLAEKAIVLLEPVSRIGEIIWSVVS